MSIPKKVILHLCADLGSDSRRHTDIPTNKPTNIKDIVMHSTQLNGATYSYGPKCSGTGFSKEIEHRDYQLFGVVLDNQRPSVIGVIHSQYEGEPAWLPMKWDLLTGKHYDGGFNLTPLEVGKQGHNT